MRRCAPILVAVLLLWSGCSLVDALQGETVDDSGDDPLGRYCSPSACWEEEEIDISMGAVDYVLATQVTSSNEFVDIVVARSDGAVDVYQRSEEGTLPFEPGLLDDELGFAPINDMVAVEQDQFGRGAAGFIAISRRDSVTILRADRSVSSISMDQEPGKLAIGDFDDDGLPDIAAALASGETAILLQANDFQEQTPRLSTSSPASEIFALAVGHFNAASGCHDLAVLQNADGQSEVTIFDCAPASLAMFEEQRNYLDNAPPVALGAGKFSQGPLDELGLATGCTSNCASYDVVRVHNGEGQYLNSLVHGSQQNQEFATADILVADFDQDGSADILLVGDGRLDGPDFILATDGDLPNNGFIEVKEFNRSGRAVGAATADVNRDGRPDIVIVHRENILRILLSVDP